MRWRHLMGLLTELCYDVEMLVPCKFLGDEVFIFLFVFPFCRCVLHTPMCKTEWFANILCILLQKTENPENIVHSLWNPLLGNLRQKKSFSRISCFENVPITIDFLCAVFAHRLRLKRCASFWELAPSSLKLICRQSFICVPAQSKLKLSSAAASSVEDLISSP